ncbi:hypothetical protein ATCV1_z831L [Acanthocystis turfacea chlorella virus 1]|uniref:Uncharacterized protein z831L n=1 Tax=Chlorovirus heliozoae TaxID=322019 RepID=A7KA91_9PHYC|nr:hypothetical protein ATCV1_z831L [Acanthocystis turfacea chlorella virus 1]ABT16965.1 hypothetical protein ATCV1_z831L [Acanthocystis turfacea chlorella virus 1]
MTVNAIAPRAYTELVRPYVTKVLLVTFVRKVNGSHRHPVFGGKFVKHVLTFARTCFDLKIHECEVFDDLWFLRNLVKRPRISVRGEIQFIREAEGDRHQFRVGKVHVISKPFTDFWRLE